MLTVNYPMLTINHARRLTVNLLMLTINLDGFIKNKRTLTYPPFRGGVCQIHDVLRKRKRRTLTKERDVSTGDQ